MLWKSKVEFKGIGNLRRPFSITSFNNDLEEVYNKNKDKG
jgi:hypothetical protein